MFDYTNLLDEKNNTSNNDSFSCAADTKEKSIAESSGGFVELDRESLSVLFNLVNGWNEDGSSKVVLTYQNHVMKDGVPVVGDAFHHAEKPTVNISFDSMNPDWFSLDVVFRSHLEPELKLLWGYLQRFKNNCAKEPNVDHIFYMNILAKDSVSEYQSGNPDYLFTINLVNPVLFYLTPEDTIHTDPNVIRMLIPVGSVEFSYNKNELFEQAKTDVVAEINDELFLNNAGGDYIE